MTDDIVTKDISNLIIFFSGLRKDGGKEGEANKHPVPLPHRKYWKEKARRRHVQESPRHVNVQ
jgi:hypothetical protein